MGEVRWARDAASGTRGSEVRGKGRRARPVGERLVVLEAVGLVADEQVARAGLGEQRGVDAERLVAQDQDLCGAVGCSAAEQSGGVLGWEE